MKKENREALLVIIFVVALTGLGFVLGTIATPQEKQVVTVAPSNCVTYFDESARTGFLNSESIMARFECLEFPIAGNDEIDTVYLIDIFKYPSLAPITFRVDSWPEAVEFLTALGEKS